MKFQLRSDSSGEILRGAMLSVEQGACLEILMSQTFGIPMLISLCAFRMITLVLSSTACQMFIQ